MPSKLPPNFDPNVEQTFRKYTLAHQLSDQLDQVVKEMDQRRDTSEARALRLSPRRGIENYSLSQLPPMVSATIDGVVSDRGHD